MTTLDPGAKLVLTHGLDFKPCSTAFFARRRAAISTEGFDVLVQLVIAAITTLPSWTMRFVLGAAPSESRKFFFTSGRLMRSCGRLGPASDGTTVLRSSSRVSEYTGSGAPSMRNNPCSRA